MSKYFIACFVYLLSCSKDDTKGEINNAVQKSCQSKIYDTCIDFNSLNNSIRDGDIEKPEALKEIQTMLPKLKKYFYKNGGEDFLTSSWIFPVEGYSLTSIGGSEGSGYNPLDYDYFDGNKHGGHPAHDIFIKDNDQDCIDDSKKNFVNVLSMTGGVVIAMETNWDTTSNLRGGKYIWIYDPTSNSLIYYAHNNSVAVQMCDIVKPGDTIATVGRTGLNAFKSRSPTHLRIMQLQLDNIQYPKPLDCYKDLKELAK